MKLGMILILLLVLLTVVLLQLLFMRREAFQTSDKVQLTAENVQELMNQFAMKMISMYQELKKEATGPTKDMRMQYRYAYFSNFISTLNEQYPYIEYTIKTYNWNNVNPNYISLEDTKNMFDFLFYKVGRTGSSSWLTPVTLNDLDMLSRSTAATMRIYGEKLMNIQGGSEIKSIIEEPIRKSLEGVTNLKKNFPVNPFDIPLLKNDSYFYALMNAIFNFVKVPELETMSQTGKFTEPAMGNLPIPKTVTQAISDLIKKDSTTAANSSAMAKATPVSVSGSNTSASQIPGSKFSELIQALISYGGLTDKSTKPSLSNDTKKTKTVSGSDENPSMINSAASVEDIRKVVRDEISEQLKTIKTGPKDNANEDISKRYTEPVNPAIPRNKTNVSAQDSWYQSATQECPYTQEQTQPQFDSLLDPTPFPYDMNDYIRKDSIPCWGCSLK